MAVTWLTILAGDRTLSSNGGEGGGLSSANTESYPLDALLSPLYLDRYKSFLPSLLPSSICCTVPVLYLYCTISKYLKEGRRDEGFLFLRGEPDARR